jgi:UDP-glucose 4-epimerase
MAFHRFFRWALEGKALEVYGDGEQSRDFTHVDDIVTANWQAAEEGLPGEVFNVGGGSRVTVNEVIEIVKETVGAGVSVRYMETQKGDVRHTSADMTKAQERLGYHPKVAIAEGLKTEYEWVKTLLSIS